MDLGVSFRTRVTRLVEAIRKGVGGNEDQIKRQSDALIEDINTAALLHSGVIRPDTEEQQLDQQKLKKLREAVIDVQRYYHDHPRIAVRHLRRALRDFEAR